MPQENVKLAMEAIRDALEFANEVAEEYGFGFNGEEGIILVEHYRENPQENESDVDWVQQIKLVKFN